MQFKFREEKLVISEEVGDILLAIGKKEGIGNESTGQEGKIIVEKYTLCTVYLFLA